MAHQAHSIPWNALCSNFQFRHGSLGPGVQHSADLFPRDDKPDLLKSIEYFARSFQDNLRDHAATSRQKYHSQEKYARRARSWTTSKSNVDQAPARTDPAADDPIPQLTPDETRRQRNLELRSLQTSLSQGWSAQPETREVYPNVFHQRFDSYLRGPLSDEWRDIDAWLIDHEHRPIWCSADSLTTFGQCHVIKMLFEAAAMQPSSQTHFVDTLFLFANHPVVRLSKYEGLCLQCCNINTGLKSLMEKVVQCYIYLNMLSVYHERASSPPKSALEHSATRDIPTDRKRPGFHGSPPEAGMFTYYTSESEMGTNVSRKEFFQYGSNVAPLSPWPAYTRFPTYCQLTRSCCYAHEDIADTPIFSPFFFPLKDRSDKNSPRVEADILADPGALKLFLTKLWKILVLYEMVRGDAYRNGSYQWQARVDWERVVLEMFSNLWHWNVKKIFGRAYHEYEDDRWPR